MIRASIFALMLMFPSAAVLAQSCGDDPILDIYRSEAKNRATATAVAILSPEAEQVVSLKPIQDAAYATNTTKFAAFYLPPTMFIGGSQAVEWEQKATENIPDLPTAWGMLLLPTASEDCRFFLLAPAAFDRVLGSNDPRRFAVAESSASALLDSVYRARFPDRPVEKNIVNAGVVDPKGKLLFADVMSEPLVLAVGPNTLPDSYPRTGLPAIENSLPHFYAWADAMQQFAWPQSLRAMHLKVSEYSRRAELISQRERATWTKESMRSDMLALQDLLRAAKPLGSLARADLDRLLLESTATGDKMIDGRLGVLVALINRNYGNVYEIFIRRAEDHHAELYSALNDAKPLSPSNPFDHQALVDFRPKAAGSVFSFKTIVVADASAAMKDVLLEGELGDALISSAKQTAAYLVFRDAADPLTGDPRVRPELVAVMPVDSLLTHVVAQARNSIQNDDCGKKFVVDSVGWEVTEGRLRGSVPVRAELWHCAKFTWVCFSGWKPRWCVNQIKTRLLRSSRTVPADIMSFAAGDTVMLTATIDMPYIGLKTHSISREIRTPKSEEYDIPRLELGGSFFARRASGDGIVLVTIARMPDMELGQAAVYAEIFKAILAKELSQ